MRSSTSFCLIAALISRIAARVSLSPPFMAAFMSSVRRCLRLIAHLPRSLNQSRTAARGGAAANAKSRPRDGVPASVPCTPCARARAHGVSSAGSVQALALGDVARHATQLALHRGSSLALALLGRLLVVLALAGFGQDTGLLAGALEATQRKLEGLVLADFDAGHGISGTQNTGSRPVSRVC